MIRALGEISLDSGNAISQARDAYNALTEPQKYLVDSYDLLTTAEDTYAQLAQAKAEKEVR